MSAADTRRITAPGLWAGARFSAASFGDDVVAGPEAIRLQRAATGASGGAVSVCDGAGVPLVSGSLDEFVTALPCFTLHSRVATADGPCAVVDLRPGHRVQTRDDGLQAVHWVGRRTFGWRALGLNPLLRPVRIAAGALGQGVPARAMIVSPNHRLLARDPVRGHAGEGLVMARDLVGLPGVTVLSPTAVDYVQILFDHHQLILVDACWSESYQPSVQGLAALTAAARVELLTLRPDLAQAAAVDACAAVRPGAGPWTVAGA